MNSTVLVFGGFGWIGSMIVELLCKRQDTEVIVSDARLETYEDVYNEINRHQPTHVISTIGRTSGYYNGQLIPNIDYLEYPGKLDDNIRDNLVVPTLIANVTNKLQIHFTYLGTGCIFSYKSDDPEYAFTEQDAPNFFGSSYSIVKGRTERLLSSYSNVLNVRIRMPITYNSHPKDFITKISQFSKICSVPNSMTVLDDLLPVMLELCLRKECGTINLVNPGTISHNEILEGYRQHVAPEHTWENSSERDLGLVSKRSNNKLCTKKLECFQFEIPDIKTSINNILVHRANVA